MRSGSDEGVAAVGCTRVAESSPRLGDCDPELSRPINAVDRRPEGRGVDRVIRLTRREAEEHHRPVGREGGAGIGVREDDSRGAIRQWPAQLCRDRRARGAERESPEQ